MAALSELTGIGESGKRSTSSFVNTVNILHFPLGFFHLRFKQDIITGHTVLRVLAGTVAVFYNSFHISVSSQLYSVFFQLYQGLTIIY